MKLSPLLLLVACLGVRADTEENFHKNFPVQAGGKLIVDVDFGSIEVSTNDTSEVSVDAVRKVRRATKGEEENFLASHPIQFTQEGNQVRIYSRANRQIKSSGSNQRTDAKYTISVPSQFNAQLKTAGGAVVVNGVSGKVNAATSGGSLKFTRLNGPLNGDTSGGGIRVVDCEGTQRLKTSGGDVAMEGGAGSFDGDTSGGSVTVKNFRGPVRVKSDGGGITVENVSGKVEGTTSGGSISARFAAPLSEEVKLATGGGGVTLRVPENSAFNLDASTSGGSVRSELAVSTKGKASSSHLMGPVNGGGKAVVLRTSGGSIRVQKL